jgi:hypothetical protein
MEHNIEKIDFKNLSKSSLLSLVDENLALWVDSGYDTLGLHAIVCKAELYFSELKKRLAKELIEEVSRNNNSMHNGVVLSIANGGAFDYSNSPAWVEVNSRIEVIKSDLKDIEAIAKVTKTRSEWTDKDGECYAVYPALAKSSETVKATIK